MADRAESADERALRLELQQLAKKREALDNSKPRAGRASGTSTGRRSVLARLGGEPSRAGGGRQVQLKENSSGGNASRRLGKRDNEDSRQNSTVKRQRLHSAVARPESGHHEGRAEPSRPATSPSADNARAQQRKQRAVAPYAQKEGIARSRRMFGALMGHLGKAKRQIEKDTDLFKRQGTKQQEAEQREKLQSQNLENQARHDAEVARLEALVERVELDRSEQIARAKLEHLQMVKKSASLSKLLVTIASPPLCYLPAKHTKETKELVAASMEAHEAKMKASARSHEDKLRKLEAEFETKLEKLREDLAAAKEGGKEKAIDETESSGKKDEAMEDGDEDMSDVQKELEEDAKQEQEGHPLEDKSSKASAMDVEDEDLVQESVSGSEGESGAVTTRSNVSEGKHDGDSRVKSERGSEDGGERDASPSETANGSTVAQHDTETSSPGRVTAEANEKEETTEEPESSKQDDEDTGKHEDEVDQPAESASQPHAVVLTDDASAKHEADDAETETKEDPTTHVAKMKVTELRKELKKRGLDVKGLKATLVQRLKEAIHGADESK